MTVRLELPAPELAAVGLPALELRAVELPALEPAARKFAPETQYMARMGTTTVRQVLAARRFMAPPGVVRVQGLTTIDRRLPAAARL